MFAVAGAITIKSAHLDKAIWSISASLCLSNISSNVLLLVRVVIDKFSFTHLEGGTLNFSDGLNGTGFGIENPNAKASCGCGSSFTV